MSPWLAFFIGTVLILWEINEKRANLRAQDLVPGIGLIAAGFFLIGLLRYLRIEEDKKRARKEALAEDLADLDSDDNHAMETIRNDY